MKRVVIGILSLLAMLGGCAHQMVQESATSEGIRHEFDQNYKVGERRTSVVGDPMIKVRDYFIERVSVPAIVPTETVTLSGGPIAPMIFSSAQSYKVRGRIEVEGVSYLVVPNSDNPVQWQAALASGDGVIYNRRAGFGPGMIGPVLVIYEQTVSPPTARLVRTTEERVVTSKGYQNYEIIYNGVANNVLQLTYREFSAEGLARTAFYQNLTYDAKSDSIRFKTFRILVHSTNSEHIDYTVVEDGR